MEKSKLSEYYAIATDRSMRSLANLYESLHTDKGDPVEKEQVITESVSETINVIRHELDMISEALKEYKGE